MPSAPKPLPPPRSREELARTELGHTDVSPALARALTLAFLALLVGTVGGQVLFDGGLPYAARLGELLPEGRVVPTRASTEAFEDRVERRSFLRRRLRPYVQAALVRVGLGNEDVVIGRHGGLFYAPDVEYVTGPGFLEPRRLARLEREHRFGGRQPDPVRAIVAFRDALAARGVELVVLPVPVKSQLAAAQLNDGALERSRERLRNPSELELLARLDAAGVRRLDVGPELDTPDAYLATDTHWSPGAMRRVARAVADELVRAGLVERGAAGTYAGRPATATGAGDVLTMLGLPAGDRLYAAEELALERVVEASTEEPWTPQAGAPVLLLGDSFTNVFSLGAMGLGEDAGLAEHLSLALQLPLDRIARNAGGAYAAREAFAAELRRDPARFAATRVVVWELAMRELAQGDWKEVPLPDAVAAGRAGPTPVETLATGDLLRVRATVAELTRPPDPATVPYRDALVVLRLEGVAAASTEEVPEALLAYAYGMRDRELTALATLDPGDAVVLLLEPWEDVEPEVGGLNRIELDDPEFRWIDLPLYWVRAVER